MGYFSFSFRGSRWPPVDARPVVTRQPAESIKNVMDRTPSLALARARRSLLPSQRKRERERGRRKTGLDTWSIGRDDYTGTLLTRGRSNEDFFIYNRQASVDERVVETRYIG